jgi:hypothetical protein
MKLVYRIDAKLAYLLFITFIIFLGACKPLYRPNTVNVPMLKEKNDVTFGTYLGTNGADVQAAYAITNNIGVMANASIINSYNATNGTQREHRFAEGGIGYFKPINKEAVFDIYAGAGNGYAYNSGNFIFNYYSFNRVNYNRFFIQPSVALVSNYFDLAASARFTYVDFYDYRSGNTSTTQNMERVSSIFMEPAITLRGGYKNVKMFGQLGFAIPTTSFAFEAQPVMFSLGLNLTLSKRFTATEDKK